MSLHEDAIPRPTGRFILDVNKDGRLIEHIDDKNLVVNGSKFLLAQLIGGQVANNSITQIGVGTNGTAPQATDIALTSQFEKAIDSVSYPASNQVQYNFSLASGDANGVTIWEFGLLSAGGTLFARKVRSSGLSKNSTISLAGSWLITF